GVRVPRAAAAGGDAPPGALAHRRDLREAGAPRRQAPLRGDGDRVPRRGGAAGGGGASGGRGDRAGTGARGGRVMRWEELRVGEGPAPRTVGPVTRTDFVRYQGASGDMNPVHHDEPFARAAGYPAPLAVGMYQAGVLNAYAVDWLGPEHVRRTRVR